MSLRENNAIFPLVTHFSAQTFVTKGKIALNFPLVTQFWEICVTQGISRYLTDIPLVTQLFSAKKCVTQGMSTVVQQLFVSKISLMDIPL